MACDDVCDDVCSTMSSIFECLVCVCVCVMLLMRVQSMYNNVYSQQILITSSLSFDAAMGRQSIETLLGSDVQ